MIWVKSWVWEAYLFCMYFIKLIILLMGINFNINFTHKEAKGFTRAQWTSRLCSATKTGLSCQHKAPSLSCLSYQACRPPSTKFVKEINKNKLQNSPLPKAGACQWCWQVWLLSPDRKEHSQTLWFLSHGQLPPWRSQGGALLDKTALLHKIGLAIYAVILLYSK